MAADTPRAPWFPDRPIWTLLPPALATACREEYEERAAIGEYCGELSRAEAERLAYAGVVARYEERAATAPVPAAGSAFGTKSAPAAPGAAPQRRVDSGDA